LNGRLLLANVAVRGLDVSIKGQIVDLLIG
jgi:hypothetical protein